MSRCEDLAQAAAMKNEWEGVLGWAAWRGSCALILLGSCHVIECMPLTALILPTTKGIFCLAAFGNAQPPMAGAKCVAWVGRGGFLKAFRTCEVLTTGMDRFLVLWRNWGLLCCWIASETITYLCRRSSSRSNCLVRMLRLPIAALLSFLQEWLKQCVSFPQTVWPH